MKAIVTGGLGYLGSMLVTSLVLDGIDVTVLDKGIFGSGHKLENVRYFKLYNDFLKYFKDNMNEDIVVYHLGGLSNDPMSNYDKAANIVVNTEFTKTLIDDLVELGWKGKFIYASSASVYGFRQELMNETSAVDPNSAYAESKYNSELLLNKKCKNDIFKLIILRKATVMGGSVRPRLDLVVNTMVASAYREGVIKLFSGGEIWRPLVHVIDVVDCYRYFGKKETLVKDKASVWNLVHKNYRISELGLYIKKLLKDKYNKNIDIESKYDVKDNRSYRMSGAKLETQGFKTRHGVQKAVYEIWDGIESGAITDDMMSYNIKWIRNCEKVCEALGRKFDLLEVMG